MKKENRELSELFTYVSPQCNVIKIEWEHFICTSVRPNAPGSEEKDYDPDEDVDGGEYEFE